jgi:hypothetical protein
MHRSLLSAAAAGVLLIRSETPPRGAQSALPSYARTLQLEPTADTSANVSIGDVNGDGKLDLVLIKGRHWPGMSRVLLGDGRGHFSGGHDLSNTRYRSYSGTLVDIDGNGTLDVVLSNDRPDPKVVLLNDGTGNFHLASSFGSPMWDTRNVAVADLNGDRLPDIVVANRAPRAAQYVCLNQGQGQFSPTCQAFADYSATTITPADVNRDGPIDLVVPNRDGGQSYVYLNDGNAAFAAASRVPFGPPDGTVRMALAGDFDGDGLIDLALIDDEHKRVELCYGAKGGGFAPATLLDSGAAPYALTVADLNRDGHPDIIVGYVESPSAVFFGAGKSRRFTRVSFGDNRGAVYGFAVADLDGDGQLDIAAARSEAPNMVYFGSAGPR